MTCRLLVSVGALFLLLPVGALAQTPPEPDCLRAPAIARCLTLAVRASLVTAEPVASAALGVNLAYDLTNRIAVDGELLHFTRAKWATSLTATAAVRVAVGPFVWSGGFVPFVLGGMGVNRATVHLSDPRVLGPIGTTVTPGSTFCPQTGLDPGPHPGLGVDPATCRAGAPAGVWGVGELPAFYANRLGALTVPAARRWPSRSFVDPAVTAGAGFLLHASDHLVLQPEVRVWVIVADRDTRTAGLFGILAGYAF